MADHSLVIDDEYVVGVGGHCKTRGRELEDILIEYIAILEEIRTEAILEGEIANALTDYIACVKLLRDRITAISNNIQTVTNNFVTDVDEADSYLF